MSLTSYRAAPPRGCGCGVGFRGLAFVEGLGGLGRPGSDLLSHALRRSTIGAEGFHGRVRDGIGWVTPRHCHQVIEARLALEGVCGEVCGWGCMSLSSSCSGRAGRSVLLVLVLAAVRVGAGLLSLFRSLAAVDQVAPVISRA